MSSLAVEAFSEGDQALAKEISLKLSLPLAVKSEISLMIREGEAFLKLNGEKKSPLYRPDFSSRTKEMKTRDELRRRGLLLRAVEGRSKEKLKVFDFHSGFAQDAFLMACTGHKVTSVEKNPYIAFVTQRAFEVQRSTDWVNEFKPDLTLKNGSSAEVLRKLNERFDVVYMDPMFEKLKASAKSPLPMQIVQALLQQDGNAGVEDSDLEEDFLTAKKFADKVVMKLPLKGLSLLSAKPSYQLLGKTIRFDIYV